MGWLLLIAGLALWSGSHYFKRLAPEQRAAMGDKAKGAVAVANVVAIVLMTIGYQRAAFVPLWYPPEFLTHLNNLLMLVAVYFFFAGRAGVRIATRVRHTQLTGVKTWAIAHLLVNGDLASVVLFGGLLAWAVGSVILINRAERDWTPPEAKGAKAEAIYAAAVVGIYVVIGLVHDWLGVWPFA
jgi:uncharacterized membrane protein